MIVIPQIYSHSESDLQKKKVTCILLLFCASYCRSSNFRQIETTTNQKSIDCEKDVTKTGSGERGAGSGERGAGNGERKSGNELSAETSIKIQYGR